MTFVLAALAARAPTQPSITATAVSSSSISVALTGASTVSVGKIAFYALFRSIQGAPFTLIQDVSPGAFPYADTGLPANTTVSYYAEAINDSPNKDASLPSVTVTATTQAASGQTPSQPQILATTQSSSTIGIALTVASTEPVNGIKNYQLQRSVGGSAYATIVTLLPTQWPHTDTGLSASTAYSYRTFAVDNSVAMTPSANSAVTTATTQAGSGAISLKTFLTNNTTLINGGAFNIYGTFGGSGPYGNGLQGIQTGTTAANSVIVDPTTGVSTGLSMAHLNIQAYQFYGPCTVAQSLALGTDWQNAGGILTLTIAPPNPVYGTGTPQLAGTNAFQSGNSVIVPGNAAYNTFHNGPYNCGYITCPNGLQSIAAFIKSLPKTVIVRVFHEMNLTGSNSWWVSNFCTPSQFQTLFKQFVLAMDAAGVTNALYEVCINWAGNNASWQQYIPAADSSRPQGYFDVISFDYYYNSLGHNVSADLNGTFSNALQSYGKPIVMGETGCGGPTPIPAQSQDNSSYGSSFHTACPWVKMLAFYAQGWQLESQKGATALMQQTTSRSQLPTLS